MTSKAPGRGRILGSLGSAAGKGVVRMESRFDGDIDEVWSALTNPSRLARWYGEVEGGRDDAKARWDDLHPAYQGLAAKLT